MFRGNGKNITFVPMAYTEQELREQAAEAAAVLKAGGVILYPTDTVWGLGCDATDPKAVERIYELKRSQGKEGMIVLVGSAAEAARYTNHVPDVAWDIMEMADKPLTLILPGGCGVAESLVAPDGTLGVRVPHHRFCEALLRVFRKPLVSTSANFSGQPAPARFAQISPEVAAMADFVVDGRFEEGATGKPSSMIALGRGGEVKVIRE